MILSCVSYLVVSGHAPLSVLVASDGADWEGLMPVKEASCPRRENGFCRDAGVCPCCSPPPFLAGLSFLGERPSPRPQGGVRGPPHLLPTGVCVCLIVSQRQARRGREWDGVPCNDTGTVRQGHGFVALWKNLLTPVATAAARPRVQT